MIYNGTLNFIVVWFAVTGTAAALTFASLRFYHAYKNGFRSCRGCCYYERRRRGRGEKK